MAGEGLNIRKTSTSICENDEEKDENNGTSTTTTTRIFVGGLGATVKAEDLRNTFSSLGTIDSVEIVRTKGRSFAYFDFLPSCQKSLSKLFSAYNGCMWKGGRLRLEKAKEHFLLCLKREWAEDAKLANSSSSNAVDATRNMDSTEKLKNVTNLEKTEVRLFFPKLRKVKLLPFNGTGKHKYSFQRVEVPPLPIHFCDCEEHSDPYHTAKEKDFSDLETQCGGIDDKELNMMKSVMNKLFEKENISKAACTETGLVNKGDNATKLVDDQLVDENETDDMTDEDNLVMNMVGGGKNITALLGSREQERVLANEVAIVNELRTSKDRPSGNVFKSERRKIVPSDKKRKSPLSAETNGNEVVPGNPERKRSAKKANLHASAQAIGLESGIEQSNKNLSWSQKSKWRDLSGERGNTSFCISDIMQSTASTKEESKSDGVNVPNFTEFQNQNLVKHTNLESQPSRSEEAKEVAATQPNKSNTASNKYARGASWLQQSSWTQLVGATNNSFSISQLLPGMTFKEQEHLKPKSMDVTNSAGGESSRGASKASGIGNEEIITANISNTIALPTGRDPELSSPQKNLQVFGDQTDEITAPKENRAAPVQQSVRNFTIGETCTFMRSDASMREWMNAKTALSGQLKKKNNEK